MQHNENAGVKMQEMENAAQNRRGGNCRKGKCDTRSQGAKNVVKVIPVLSNVCL